MPRYYLLSMLLLTLLLPACGDAPASPTPGLVVPPALTATPVPPQLPTIAVVSPLPVSGALDQVYIDTMIPHHQLALDMAAVALEHAEHGEITSLARDIQVDQADEIRWFRGWRETWWP